MSGIADVASITLITGVPGNGKTLRAVWYMQQAVKAGEAVFASNINGLAVEGVTDFADPTQWEKLDAGSILVVDEAQRFFRANSGAVPSYIQAMETIRHCGIRLILLTQSPLLIHANIRALVGLHEHMVRQNGKELSTVYRRSRVMDNVRSEKALLSEDHESWAFPKECYGLYKSAEVHTVKRSLSSKAKRGIVLALIAASLVGYAIWNGKNLFAGQSKGAGDAAAATGASATGAAAADLLPGNSARRQVLYATPTDYARAHLPRFASMPETAPVFDDRPVVSVPALYCMSSMPAASDDRDASCTCLTEQGTKYDISQPECRTLARFGPIYNPYKAPKVEMVNALPAGVTPASAGGAQVSGSVIGRSDRALGSFPENEPYKSSTYITTPPRPGFM